MTNNEVNSFLKIADCPHCGREITQAQINERESYKIFLSQEKIALRRLALSYFLTSFLSFVSVGIVLLFNAEKLGQVLGRFFELSVVFFLAMPLVLFVFRYLQAREGLFKDFKKDRAIYPFKFS